MRLLGTTILLGLLAVPLSARAEDSLNIPHLVNDADAMNGVKEKKAIELSGGVGLVFLEANEIVYPVAGSSNHLSQLIWQSTAPTLTGNMTVNLPEGWTIAVNAQAAMGGGYMEDYDWFGPFFVSYGFNDWTHRSQHSATDLDWYFNGSILLGRDFDVNNNVSVNLNGGLKYTDIQWSASGGNFVYSTGGFRDDIFSLPNSVKGVSYRQQIPAIIVGVDTEVVQDQWTFGFSAHGGATFHATSDDRHWLRNLRFSDSFNASPLISIGASADYEVSNGVHLFVQGTAEKVFTARGDTAYSDLSGNPLGALTDVAGANLFAASVTGGVKGAF